jgi:peptidoglycan/LPS O-acetylase OafA/YrhL
MHRREEGPMLHSLASSTFRRYIRLYGSSVVALFVALVTLRLRIYNGVYFIQIYHENLGVQLLHWLNDVTKFCNPFSSDVTDLKDNNPLSSDYLPQMWTIPVEYRGSVFLFSFCTAICRFTPRARMLAMWLVIAASYYWQAVYIAEFTSGLFVAQLSICRHPERVWNPPELPTDNDEKPDQHQSLASKFLHSAMFIVGFILLGEIDDGQADLLLWGWFPWIYLNKIIPFWWPETGGYVFWLGWGSFALVYSLEFYPALQRPLGWTISRYLGDISFGLYAMHVPFGMGIKQQFLDSWRETHLGESIWAYMLMALIITFVVVTAADYFTKIDRAIVRSARWLQDRLFTTWN